MQAGSMKSLVVVRSLVQMRMWFNPCKSLSACELMVPFCYGMPRRSRQ